jgi:hypothetical protein
MDNTTRNWISTLVGAVLAVGIGAADPLVGSHFGVTADTLFIVAGLGALGVNVALNTPASSETQTLADRVAALEAKHTSS